MRAAVLADAGAIAAVHVAVWQQAYADLLPASLLANLSVTRREQMWRQALQGTLEHVLVAEVDGRLVGFVSFGPTRDEDLDKQQEGEVYAIYLLANFWDQGIGKALWQAAMTALARMGFTAVSLWVLDTNTRAITFYEAMGLQADGKEKVEQIGAGAATIKELRYRHSFQ